MTGTRMSLSDCFRFAGAICYSAGAENVHAIAPSNSGFHGTMQVWWQCPGGAATGEHLQPGPVPPKFDKVAGRPAWQKDL